MNNLAYKYRIYPNKQQKEYFAKCFGCVRFFYNKSLSDMNDIYKNTKKFEDITPATYKEEFKFLKEVDSLCLANAQLNRNKAFKSFFRHQNSFPKFKSKRNEQCFSTNNQKGTVSISNQKYLSIPKCKNIKIKKHRDFAGEIKTVTISKTCDDKYFVSILVKIDEFAINKNNETNKCIGVDLGIKDFAITSDGTKYKNNKYLKKSMERLEKEQRKLSKMVKGSSNRNKQRIKVAKLHCHIKNQRIDYSHKLSHKLINENQVICLESLKVKNMEQNGKLARSIADVSWSRFVDMLDYKAKLYGKIIIKIPSNYPSSQLCSTCGYQNTETKKLSIRSWVCPNCGSVHDRDINAAKNILREGLEILKAGAQPVSSLILEP